MVQIIRRIQSDPDMVVIDQKNKKGNKNEMPKMQKRNERWIFVL